MKLSKIFHVLSIVAGFAGAIALIGGVFGGGDNIVFGVTKLDVLACSAILILIAIWLQIATIHHMMLEKKGEIV